MINEKRVLDTFLEYVQIDSESRNEKEMAERLVADLQALGLEVKTDHAGEGFGSNGFNVCAYLEGTLPGETTIMNAHMDTVAPGNGIKPIVENGIVHTDGSTILGADDKAGVAAIMEAVRTVIEKKLPCRNTEILFTIGEDCGLYGAKHMDYSMLKGKEVYVFDHTGEVGKVVNCGPGQINIRATVIGKSSHAGLAPENGISAIKVAAKAIAKMNLMRIDEETTCNIGTWKAEYATNIVPDQAKLIAEVRSRNLDKLNAQANHIKDCLQETCDEMGAKLEIELTTNYVSFQIELDDPLVKRVEEACGRLGYRFYSEKGAGGSDANIMILHGIKPLVVGVGMTDAHTGNEFIKIDDLNKSAELVLDLMTH
ncbi:MAG: M20/M25/M40 family metallo-hydrolase [Lachnospiraceae bacterium]|nr:M20/M25/M40 family metallo-hydrolase [Lachnospiraceae bacterium]